VDALIRLILVRLCPLADRQRPPALGLLTCRSAARRVGQAWASWCCSWRPLSGLG